MEKIRLEKQKLIEEKKLKKDKNESFIYRKDGSFYELIGKDEKCIDDEIPFSIYDSWEYCRLSSIVNIKWGKRIPVGRKLLDSVTPYKYIRVADMHNGTVLLNNIKYVAEDIYPQIA